MAGPYLPLSRSVVLPASGCDMLWLSFNPPPLSAIPSPAPALTQ